MRKQLHIWIMAAIVGSAVGASAEPNAPAREPDTARPLAWLVAAQNDDGGWGDGLKTAPDVATTAISGLALLRMGHTYAAGAHRASTRKAIDFVVAAVERTPQDEIDVNPAGTLPQRKLGRHIDTFLAAQYLAEALPGIPSGPAHDRAKTALDRVIGKIYLAQRGDGSYAADGWAPVLSSAFANQGLYAARAAGEPVRREALARGETYMLNQYDAKTRQFQTNASAGVGLYQVAGTAAAAAQSGQMDAPAAKAAMDKLGDESFLRGFGTYGGEEHVSYMMTSEALASVGGKDWDKWNQAIHARLGAIQRQDGTWRGDHCITSTSFCTAASLITLTIHSKTQQHG